MALVVIESWGRLVALAVTMVVAYAGLVAVLRISGKRTLSKLNAFDFVVTIALGSTLATVVVSRDVALAEGLLALGGLVILQYVVARSTRQWPSFNRLVKSEPTALVVDGRLREEALDRCRLRHDEVAAVLRKQGIASFHDVDYVVLETDGTFSILRRSCDASALAGVEGVSDHDQRARRSESER